MITLAIDLGGTRIKLGVVRDGAVLARDILSAQSDRGMAAQLESVAAALRRLCADAGVEPAAATGIGFCFPGLTDPECRRVVSAQGKYEDATAVDLVAWGGKAFGLAVLIENDARVALLGEQAFGAGRGCDDLVMVTLGTGIGGAAMIGGRLLRGRHGQAGVLGGHLSLRLDGRRCHCGNLGCAETEASNAWLPVVARERADFAASRLAREPALDYAAVFRLASEGDVCAAGIRAHSLAVWSAAIVNLIHAYDPVRVIVGGGIMASAAAILPALREHVRRHAHTPWGAVEVVAAELGDDFALLGCEVLLRGAHEAVPAVMTSNYDKFPAVEVPGGAGACVAGWEAIGARLRLAVAGRGAGARTVVAVECYPGVDEAGVRGELARLLGPAAVVDAREALRAEAEVERLVEPFLGGDDPVFGFLCGLDLPQFFDGERLGALRARAAGVACGLVLVVGCGALLVAPEPDVLVYADLARYEAQLRFRRGEAGNLGADNRSGSAGPKYKRAFFIDWRVCDRWKRPLIARWNFVLDTHDPRLPKLAEGAAVRRGLEHAVTRPFRAVPFFDPAPWGGQWMKRVCGLDGSAPNYGWCFDCVPEENSLLLAFGRLRVELPSIDLVFAHPRALLGEAVHARFGDEFPIRFDLLDTMGGGNLSFQVHPLTEYIQQRFGMHYTQDESYYVLEAAPGAEVHLGLREGVDPAAMARDLRAAQAGGPGFPDERYVNRWPARKHDHFLIPAGTCHCQGRDSMVLEISATPYIFTFKMWDWGRLGLDGRPRPIHLDHGLANLQWGRTTRWVREQLVNRIEPLGAGEGWREERTGLHAREFIETRRHWFTDRVPHDTGGGVNVLNLVEGREAVVESPEGAFEPFVVHYAETFIVPAEVRRYSIRPFGEASGRECATIKAFVRT